MKKNMTFVALFFTLFLFGGAVSQAALTPNAPYTITIQKMNSDGTVSEYSTTSATADADGKLSFSLSSLPTNADCNFIVFLITDASGQVVRKGFVPAPPAGSTNALGVNTLSTAQTNTVLAATAAAGTDNPMAVVFILCLLRSPDATESDANILAQLGPGKRFLGITASRGSSWPTASPRLS